MFYFLFIYVKQYLLAITSKWQKEIILIFYIRQLFLPWKSGHYFSQEIHPYNFKIHKTAWETVLSETERALFILESLTNIKVYFYDIMYG